MQLWELLKLTPQSRQQSNILLLSLKAAPSETIIEQLPWLRDYREERQMSFLFYGKALGMTL